MKLPIYCSLCITDADKPRMALALVELQEDDLYVFTCSRGHVSKTYLQANRFEVLFDLGLEAAVDGYHRQSIANFMSSLERFYEWYINLSCLVRGINYENRERIWKSISQQSERQLGAFYYLWTIDFGDAPLMLPQRQVKFRNNIIHKGQIPSRKEALEFGQDVINLLYEQMNQVKNLHSDAVDKLTLQRIINQSKISSSQFSTMALATSINTIGSYDPDHRPDIAKLIRDIVMRMGRSTKLLNSLVGKLVHRSAYIWDSDTRSHQQQVTCRYVHRWTPVHRAAAPPCSGPRRVRASGYRSRRRQAPSGRAVPAWHPVAAGTG